MLPFLIKLAPVLLKTVKVAVVLLPHVLAARQQLQTRAAKPTKPLKDISP